jgi:hypothetical protein
MQEMARCSVHWEFFMIKHMLLLAVGIATNFSACAGEPSCIGSPHQKAREVLSALEDRGNDTDTLLNVYSTGFSSQFKRSVEFREFAMNIRQIQERLYSSTPNKRSWETRNLQGPVIQETPGEQFEVSFITSSPVGKVMQVAFVICEQGNWVLSGFRFVPMSNSSPQSFK